MPRRRMSLLSPFLLLIFPAIFSLFLIFQGTDRDFRIRLTPNGRLKCTNGDGCSLPKTRILNFLVVGDIGGLPIYPYYSYAQTKVARAMIHAARKQSLNFIINVGDNFYFNGVENVFDSRIEDSFEKIYDEPELLVPWYTIGGNHDHLGNISAQIAHTHFSSKWTYPDLFYKIRISFDNETNSSINQSHQKDPVVLEILMLDTIVLCGNTVDVEGQSMFSWLFAKKKDPDGPDSQYVELAQKQWEWIEQQLNYSSADYLLVIGHYPIYSTCEHGGFSCLQRLDALLRKYRANAYFSGHDHNLQHIRMTNQQMDNNKEVMDYIVCGAASRSDRSAKHLNDVPPNALLFRYPTGWNPFSQIGFSNGGFIQASLERNNGKFVFLNGKQEKKYTFEMKPRQRRESEK